MKLKKANQPTFSYPTKESIKPILWSMGTAIVLSSCGTQEPPLIAGGMIGVPIGYQDKTPTKAPKPFHVEKKKIQTSPKKQAVEVKEPEALGGVSPLPQE